jgi:hypothetical protein
VNFPYLACLLGLGIKIARPAYISKIYLTGKATIEQSFKKLLGQNHLSFSYKDTSWKYGFSDPIADFARLGRSLFSKINY